MLKATSTSPAAAPAGSALSQNWSRGDTCADTWQPVVSSPRPKMWGRCVRKGRVGPFRSLMSSILEANMAAKGGGAVWPALTARQQLQDRWHSSQGDRLSSEGAAAPLAFSCRPPRAVHCAALPSLLPPATAGLPSACRTGTCRPSCSSSESEAASADGLGHLPDGFNIEVTQRNFDAILPVIRQAVSECHYLSLDCEMTGLYRSESSVCYFDTLEDRYEELVKSARTFIPTQLGVSCFAPNGITYEARTFNMHIFPFASNGYHRRFSCEPRAIEFLSECGFDFNKCFGEGVPFMPLEERDAQLARLQQKRQRQLDVRTRGQAEFIEKLTEKVTTWLFSSQKQSLGFQTVPPLLFELQLQGLRKIQSRISGKHSFIIKLSTLESATSVRLVRASPEEVAAWNLAEEKREDDEVRAAAGASVLLEIIRSSNKPVVGHTPLFDIMYSLESFAGRLPDTYPGFKEMVRTWFPGGLYDTKLIALKNKSIFGSDTSLSTLHNGLHCREEGHPSIPVVQQRQGSVEVGAEEENWPDSSSRAAASPAAAPLPKLDIRHASGFTRYGEAATSSQSYSHEAGYDAFMTGVVFAYHLLLLQTRPSRGSELPETLDDMQPFRGQLHLVYSDYLFINLWGADVMPQRPSLLFLSGLGEGDDKAAVVRVCKAAFLRSFNVDISRGRCLAIVQLNKPDSNQGAARVAQVFRTAVIKEGKQWTVETLADRLGPTKDPPPAQQHAGSGPGIPQPPVTSNSEDYSDAPATPMPVPTLKRPLSPRDSR